MQTLLSLGHQFYMFWRRCLTSMLPFTWRTRRRWARWRRCSAQSHSRYVRVLTVYADGGCDDDAVIISCCHQQSEHLSMSVILQQCRLRLSFVFLLIAVVFWCWFSLYCHVLSLWVVSVVFLPPQSGFLVELQQAGLP